MTLSIATSECAAEKLQAQASLARATTGDGESWGEQSGDGYRFASSRDWAYFAASRPRGAATPRTVVGRRVHPRVPSCYGVHPAPNDASTSGIMMSNTCLSFIIPLSPVSLVWSMLQAPGLAGVALFGSAIFGSAIAVDVTLSVANATTSEIVVNSFLLISFLLPFVAVTRCIPAAHLPE
jgi:hypothetical protein